MAKVKVSDIYPTLNAITSVLSAESDSLRIRLGKNGSFQMNVYDKERDLEVFANFPGIVQSEKTQYFSLEANRFKKLIAKHSEMDLELNKNMLFYAHGKTKGKIEIQETEKFEVPNVEESSASLNNIIFQNLPRVKLTPLFKDRGEMMLFAEYRASTGLMNLCCADNFHVSLLNITKAKAGDKDFNLTLPLRYIDIAKRFSNDGKITLATLEDTTFFFTEFVKIKLPGVSVEGTSINLPNALEHFKTLADSKSITFTMDIEPLKLFLDNSLSIKEKDKGSDISLTLKDNSLKAKIETQHGTVLTSIPIDTKKEAEIKLKCEALGDFTDKLDGKVKLSIVGENIVIEQEVDSKKGSVVKYTTVGVE